MKSRFTALILAFALTGCAANQPPSVPGTPQQKLAALQIADTSQQTLIQAVHVEAGICNAAASKANPNAPVLTCEGPIAASAKLTTERHQAFSASLLKAFELHRESVSRLDSWKPGEPIPITLGTFEAQVQAILALSQGLGGADAAALSDLVTKILKQIADIRAALGR